MSIGKFIVFEGIDGSGKTTVINELSRQLEAQCKSVIVMDSRNADSIIGKAIREWTDDKEEISNHLQITTLYLSALIGVSNGSTAFHGIDALRSKYDYILMDRWVYSTLVYGTIPIENSVSDVIENSMIHTIIETVQRSLATPDIVYFMEIDPGLASERINNRDGVLRDFFTIPEKQVIYSNKFRSLSTTEQSCVILNAKLPIQEIIDIVLNDITNDNNEESSNVFSK